MGLGDLRYHCNAGLAKRLRPSSDMREIRGSIPRFSTYSECGEHWCSISLENCAMQPHDGSIPSRSAYMVNEVKLVRRAAVNRITVGSRPTIHPYGVVTER